MTSELIGKGYAGCVFWPPMPCETGSSRVKGNVKQVGKVVRLYKARREEWAANVFAKIDPEHTFTLPYNGSCTVSRKVLNKADKALRCHLTSVTDQDLAQLVFAKGGWTLQDILDKGLTKQTFRSLFAGLDSLMLGLDKMSSSNICHCDVKPDNLLCFQNRLFLIDYGVVTNSRAVFRPKSLMLSHNDWYTPPEVTFYTKREMSFENKLQRIAEPLFKLVQSHGFKPETFLGHLQIKQLKDLADLTRSRQGQKMMVRNGAVKHDTYRLGMIIKLMAAVTQTSSKALDNLVDRMTDMNPVTRCSARQAYRLYVQT